MLDQINLQTLHLFNSSYLRYVKSPRIYAAHSTQTSYFTPNTLCKAHNLMSLPKVQNHNASTSNNMAFRHLPKPTRDPINISQTVYFLTVRLRYTYSNSNSGTTFFSCLFILIHLISLPHQTCKKSYQTFHLLTYSYL